MNNKTKKITLIGVLSAMSAILYLFPTFPIFPAFSWLEIDFADIPALLAAVTVSPLAGGVIVLIRNTVHLAVSSTAMIGELSNFLISFTFVCTTGFTYKLLAGSKPEGFGVKKVSASVFIGALFQIVAAMAVNYFIMIPLYSAFVDFSEIGVAYYIFGGVLPFNAIKDAVAGIIYIIVGKYVFPVLERTLKA